MTARHRRAVVVVAAAGEGLLSSLRVSEPRFSIAQVTPYAWERAHEVNTHVREVSAELAARGHRVLIVAPSSSPQLVREGRRLIRADGDGLLDRADGEPLLLAVGEAMATPLPGRRRAAALPMDVTRTLGDLFEHAPLDITHVHEPFAPSIAGAALRSSRALNVGSFHAPTERIVSTQVARKVVQLIFGRLDARTASYPTTAEIMARHFPATYRPLPPGAPALERAARPQGAPLRIAFVDEEERQALRLLLRALRHVETDEPWELVVLGGSGPSSTPLRADLRDRVRYIGAEDAGEDELLQNADILVAASNGSEPQPALVARASAAGAVPLASGLSRLHRRRRRRRARTAVPGPRPRGARRTAEPAARRRRAARAPAGRRAAAPVERRRRRGRGALRRDRRAAQGPGG